MAGLNNERGAVFHNAYSELSTENGSAESFGKWIDAIESMDDSSREGAYLEIMDWGNQALLDWVHDSIGLLIGGNYAEDDFYRRLWMLISNGGFLPDEESRLFALAITLIDNRLPYRKLTLVTMDDDEYSDKARALQEDIDEALRLTRLSYFQLTQEASAYLGVIRKYESLEQQAVVLSAIIGAYQRRISQSDAE